jgi:hypothetical protein
MNTWVPEHMSTKSSPRSRICAFRQAVLRGAYALSNFIIVNSGGIPILPGYPR